MTIPEHIEPHKQFAYSLVEYKWGEEQWKYFDALIERESGWNPKAQNPTSSAFGLGQFLDSTWQLVECEKTDNANTQVVCTTKYIAKNYGTPQKALEYHNINNYY